MSSSFEDWAIVELMGHRRLGGFVRHCELFGASMLRIDVPSAAKPGETHVTQYYAPTALYCVTPCTEEAALAVARLSQPAPVHRFELPTADDQSPESEGEQW